MNDDTRSQAHVIHEELERFFDLVPDMACIASTDGYFRKINHAWQKTLGYTEEEILSTPILDLIHPDDREATMVEVERQVAGQPTVQFVNRYRCKDGSYRWLEWVATPCVERKWLYATARDITEDRRIRTELQESRNQLQATLDALPDLLFELGPDGRYHGCHTAQPELLAAPVEALLGKTVHEALPREAADTVICALREALEKGRSTGRQIELPLPQGSLWFELSVSLKPGAGSREPRFIVLSRDITGRKEAETALSRSEAHLREIIDMIPVALFVKDPDSRITLMNRACEEQWGMSFSELRGTDASQFFPPEQMALFLAKDREVFAGRQLVDFEETVWRAALKEDRIMHTFKKPVFDEAGKPLYLIGVSVDITERKRAERLLSESENKYRSLIELAGDAIFLADADSGIILDCNRNAARLIGRPKEKIIGSNQSRLHPPEEAAHYREMFRRHVECGGSIDQDVYVIHKDGHAIPVDIHASVIDLNGVGVILGAFRDITERKRAENELRELNERLEERVEQRTRELVQAKQLAESANRIKGEFLANMSHEIRTPLNSILGMANLALNQEASPKGRDYLDKIRLSGEHLLGIIDDILDFSKLDAGKLKIDVADFDLRRVLESVNNLVAGKAAAKGLELVFDTDAGLSLNLRGDPLRLVQILANYADNAVKFTERGRVTVRTRKIGEDEAGCRVRFEVQDTGIGIGEAEKARLFQPFQPFQQLDASATRQYGGTGLGLAISRQLAAMMRDGEVGVESVPGQGSTFWFSVRLDKSGRPVGPEREGNVPPALLGAIRNRRILLVENNLFNQQVAAEFLENAGATVCVAQNGREALDLLRHDHFDCVLMDIQMPVMDGFETTRLIRANPALDGMPVIAMTANASADDRERCLAAGMNGFVGKPFKPHEFYVAIARCMGGEDAVQASSPVRHDGGAARTDEAAPLDLAVLSGLVGGDRAKMREFAARFLASANGDMAQVEAALAREDWPALAALGHHMKSPARMAGAAGFADLCQVLEDHGKGGANPEQVRDVASRMRLLLERIGEQASREFP